MKKPTWERGNVRLYLGDCREVLTTLGRFECCVTDPPYGIDACSMTLGTGKKEFVRGDWDRARPDMTGIMQAAELVCVWGGNYFADVLPISNDWLIWHKKNDGLSFSECEMAWTNFGCNTRHLSHHWSGEEKQHPTQKPKRVLEWCLSFVPSGMSIVDPYMGSGTTGVASVQTGRSFVGIEIDPTYFEIAVRRIDKAIDAGALFAPVPPAVREASLFEAATLTRAKEAK